MENDNIELLNTCDWLVKSIAVFIIIASIGVIVGTIFQISVLTSILAAWKNMKINAALCFLLSGLALLLLNNKKRHILINILVAVISIIILLVSVLTISEYLFSYDLGIDQFFIKDNLPLSQPTPSPGRMALIAAMDFMLAAITYLLLLKKSISVWVTQTIIWVILLITFVSVCNYIYITDEQYFLVKLTTMPMNTNVLFLLLGFGILLLKPTDGMLEIILKKSTGGYLLRYMIPVLIITPLLIDMITHYLQRRNLMDPDFGDLIMAIATMVIVGLFVLIFAKSIDRKEKEIAIVEIEAQHNEMIFRQFAENIDIVFYTTSADLSKILYVSPAYERIWGRSTESLYKNPKEWFEAILLEDQLIATEAFFTAFQKEDISASAEYRIQRPDGSIRHVFTRLNRLKDEKNNVFCVIGIAVDMTNIKIEKIHKELQHQILQLIENEKNIIDFSPKVLKLICRTLDYDLGELWLIDESKNNLRCVDVWHKGSQLLRNFYLKSSQNTFTVTEDFPGRIWKTKLPLFIPNYSENNLFIRSEDAKTAGLNSVFGIPLMYHDRIFGIMEFFSSNIRKPEPEFMVLMENIGKSIGEFIERFYASKKNQDITRYDFLTGLLNRAAFEEDLDKLITDEKSTSIAVFVVNIDRFKLINEAFGHANGDIILKIVASRLSSLRKDAKINLSRLGADKFIFYLPEAKTKDAHDFALTTKQLFKEAVELAGNTIKLSASIGIALYPQDGFDGSTLVMNADLAMNETKYQGGDGIHFFTKELALTASKTIIMDTELRQAMKDNQFILAYQPQIDLKTDAICAAEVLLRWQHPVDGLILPGAFIHFAEKNNLIVALNEYVIRMAFQQISSNSLEIPISINISVQQFKEGFHLVEYLELLMHEFSISSKNIELEITENMLLEDTEHNIAVLTALHELGFKIAIDDFGTGYSSFGYLNRLPVHKIKIDKSFITGLPDNATNAKIVKAMITMVHSLDKVVVAEGAETKAEVDFLKREKCDIVQGFYYYKPMSFDKFSALNKRKSQRK